MWKRNMLQKSTNDMPKKNPARKLKGWSRKVEYGIQKKGLDEYELDVLPDLERDEHKADFRVSLAKVSSLFGLHL